jgi:hypothetical protein
MIPLCRALFRMLSEKYALKILGNMLINSHRMPVSLTKKELLLYIIDYSLG